MAAALATILIAAACSSRHLPPTSPDAGVPAAEDARVVQVDAPRLQADARPGDESPPSDAAATGDAPALDSGAGSFSIQPAEHDFRRVGVNNYRSVAVALHLPTRGPIEAAAVTAVLEGAGAAQFTVQACMPPYQSTDGCRLPVLFWPKSFGSFESTLRVTYQGETRTVPLRGEGTTPARLRVLPPAVSFGVAVLGQTPPEAVVTLDNPGGGDLYSVIVSLGTQNKGNFEVVSHTCEGPLEAGRACQVTVRMLTATVGRKGVWLRLSTPPLTTLVVDLTGTVVAPDGGTP